MDKSIFENIEPKEFHLIEPLIEEATFIENQLNELKKLPFILTYKGDASFQKKTEAAKLYKELSANYANIVRILLNTLRKVESDAQNELLKRLEEFS